MEIRPAKKVKNHLINCVARQCGQVNTGHRNVGAMSLENLHRFSKTLQTIKNPHITYLAMGRILFYSENKLKEK